MITEHLEAKLVRMRIKSALLACSHYTKLCSSKQHALEQRRNFHAT
jgi:hypothetical protein